VMLQQNDSTAIDFKAFTELKIKAASRFVFAKFGGGVAARKAACAAP
jgi:hypothetical protein